MGRRSDQAGLCFWCFRGLEEPVWNERKNRWTQPVAHREHLIPRIAGGRNGANVVLSCSVCNLLKSDQVFDSIEEGRELLRRWRREAGYRDEVETPLTERVYRCYFCAEEFSPRIDGQKFCSSKCRAANKRELVKPTRIFEKTCAECGAPFKTADEDRETCSYLCANLLSKAPRQPRTTILRESMTDDELRELLRRFLRRTRGSGRFRLRF